MIIAYKELRRLEHAILKQIVILESEDRQRQMTMLTESRINIENFYGIEIDDFAVEVAILYSAALSANTTTVVALFVGAVLGLLVMKVASVIAERRAIRRDYKRIEKLMADTEAELEKYRADHDR